jgi:hypothetical protein
MSKTLAEILQESLDSVVRPDSYDAFTRSLKRDPQSTPTLPQVRESPENLGPPAVMPTTSTVAGT